MNAWDDGGTTFLWSLKTIGQLRQAVAWLVFIVLYIYIYKAEQCTYLFSKRLLESEAERRGIDKPSRRQEAGYRLVNVRWELGDLIPIPEQIG